MTLGPREKKTAIVVAVVVAVLLVVSALIDPLATWGVNRGLRQAPGVVGHVDAVHIGLLSATVQAENLSVDQVVEGDTLHALDVDHVTVKLGRRAALHGIVRATVHVEGPHITLWRAAMEEERGPMPNVPQVLRQLLPIKLDEVRIARGSVRYRDPSVTPPVDVRMRDIAVTATNLTNREQLKDAMFARVNLQAVPFDEGLLRVGMKVDPLQRKPTFAMTTELSALRVTRLNDLLRAYTRFEASAGQGDVFAEYAASDGRFKGYVKPIFEHLDVHAWENASDTSTLDKFWRNVVGSTLEVLGRGPHEKLGTKVPMEGTFEQPDIDVWYAAVTLARNGFVQAVVPTLERSVNLETVAD